MKSSLSLNLSRHELGIFIECRVESAALPDTFRNQIFFDMHGNLYNVARKNNIVLIFASIYFQVRPTQVQLSGINKRIEDGIIVQAVCLVCRY